MDIEISKYFDKNWVYVKWHPQFWAKRRLNSAMTKDLIKEEMRVRVLSFRPTMQGLFVLHFSNYLHKASL